MLIDKDSDKKNPTKDLLDPKEFLDKKKSEDDEDEDSGGFDSDSTDEDDDQNFIKKDGEQKAENKEEKTEEASSKKNTALSGIQEELTGVVKHLKNLIFPERNQQRNLDRETGGLEAEKDKGISEKDVWDGRSEEVDKMGSTDTFNTTGMRSAIWRKKFEKLQAMKHGGKHQDKKQKNKEGGKDLPDQPKMGFTAKLTKSRTLDTSTADSKDKEFAKLILDHSTAHSKNDFSR